ncbi:MAG: glycosyltransferase family 39 protein, partial [Bdellovibrionales bacterium]|nr:glycosyltransferase family 39 protein [Bdellovibrionales bacterium]
FFYPQTPLFPYLYGIWCKFAGFTWESARALSAIFSILIGIILFKFLKSKSSKIIASILFLVFTFSGMNIAWLVTIKPYGTSAFLILILYILMEKKITRPLQIVFIGFIIGLLFNIRSYLVVIGLIPSFLIFLSKEQFSTKLKQFLLLAFGAFLTLLPHIYWILKDFDVYYFNNIGFHLMRSEDSSAELAQGKLNVLYYLLGINSNIKFEGFQFSILVWSWIICFLQSVLKKKLPSLAWFFCLLIFIISFVPSPAWLQYFSVALPLLIICFYELIKEWPATIKLSSCIALLLYTTYTGSIDFNSYTNTGEGVHGIYETNLEASRIKNIDQISKKIDEYVSPGDKVVSVWPGYLFESHAEIYPGMENQFWIRVENQLNDDQAKRYRVMTLRALQEVVRKQQVKLLIIDLHKAGRFFPRKILQKSGYKEIAKLHNVLFYVH